MSQDKISGNDSGNHAKLSPARVDDAHVKDAHGELAQALKRVLEPVLSTRRPVGQLATSLASLDQPSQRFVTHWCGIIARTNAELAFQFAELSPRALRRVGTQAAEGWIINAMDVYDARGLYPAVEALRNVDDFLVKSAASARSAHFEGVAGVLRHYIHGLSGRTLELRGSDSCFTDTQSVFLPETIARMPDPADNFRLYKAMSTHLWAQSWYGTFRKPAAGTSVFEFAQQYTDSDYALSLFTLLETIRLDACIERDLPGMARDLATLSEADENHEWPAHWQQWIDGLKNADSSVETTYEALASLYDPTSPLPAPLNYQSEIRPEDVLKIMEARQAHEKADFQRKLRELARQQGLDDNELEVESTEGTNRLTLETSEEEVADADGELELSLDGEPIAIPADLRELIDSIIQDFGAIPDDYTTFSQSMPATGGEEGEFEPQDPDSEPTWVYDEWDYRRQHYRKDWCELREVDLKPDDALFVDQTLEKYAGTVQQIRKSFEIMRGETRIARRQTDGDGIDLDAVIDAFVEANRGEEFSDALFTRLSRTERDMAVVFMVDVSGSTKGWINDAERESLVLLCEALETLGDRYAIYGFSGTTRKRCELFPIKRFEDAYATEVKSRIAGMRPRDYTRMGVIIRHLTQQMMKIEARTRLLITLSDGKPDDYDGYGGEYGIEDTRKALIEAKHAGIHPFCITIDSEAHDYLPRMYGDVNYTFVREVRQLPLRVSDIYRKLTT